MRLDILSNAGKAGAEARWGKGQDGKRKRPQSDRNARKENNTLQNKLLFETFWITARRKIGKLDAERAFLKAMKRKDAGDLMAVWESYNAGIGSDLKYVPNPATWLNQGRWLDEATTQASGETGRARPLKSGGFYVGN